MVEAKDVTVRIRMNTKPNSKMRAHADVLINLGGSDEISIMGWCVIGNPIWVAPPARKVGEHFFQVIALEGRVKALVYTMIDKAFEEALRKPAEVGK